MQTEIHLPETTSARKIWSNRTRHLPVTIMLCMHLSTRYCITFHETCIWHIIEKKIDNKGLVCFNEYYPYYLFISCCDIKYNTVLCTTILITILFYFDNTPVQYIYILWLFAIHVRKINDITI